MKEAQGRLTRCGDQIFVPKSVVELRKKHGQKNSIPRRLMFADDIAMTVGSEEDSDKRYRSSDSKKGNKKGEKTWQLGEKDMAAG